MSRALTLRRLAGDRAEEVAARYLIALGWSIVGRNVRLGRSELDIVAVEPTAGAAFVVVEVRSRSGCSFGAPEESVDASKVARLYAAAWHLVRAGCLPGGRRLSPGEPRVDLICVVRDGAREDAWRVSQHLRGLPPP